MQLSYGSTCEVNGKWEMVNGKAGLGLGALVFGLWSLNYGPAAL
jgi:hypothetical protein